MPNRFFPTRRHAQLLRVTASMKDKARGLIYVTNGDVCIIKQSRKPEEAIVDNYALDISCISQKQSLLQ